MNTKDAKIRDARSPELLDFVRWYLLSHHRGPVGEPGEGSFTGTFERKRKCISGFLFLDAEDIKSQVCGSSGTLARVTDPLSWYQIMGHKGPVYKV